MYCLPCFVWLVLLVAPMQKHSEKQTLVGVKKQSKQAERAVRTAKYLCLFQAKRAVRAAKCLFCFVPAISALVLLKRMFHKLTCVEQSIFLDSFSSLQIVISGNGDNL